MSSRVDWYINCLLADALDVYYLYRGRDRTAVPKVLRLSIAIKSSRWRELHRIRHLEAM
jgi:hypothetical protein